MRTCSGRAPGSKSKRHAGCCGWKAHFPARVTEWVVLDTLIKADDPSPFPALTQLQIFGHDL